MPKRPLLYNWIEIGKEEGLLNDEVQAMKNERSKNTGTLLKTHSPNPILKWIKTTIMKKTGQRRSMQSGHIQNSTTSAHQQALADARSKTRPPMFERGPYKFKKIQFDVDQPERDQTKDDLIGDDLKQYEGDIEAMNLILISIPNKIYNYVDSCQTAIDMWIRVKRLIQGIELSDIDRETRFNNEFDQFTTEADESLTSVYNRFSQLVNDLKRNKIELPNVTINTKFLNCLQPEWYKEKKAAKKHDPLTLVAHTSSSSSRSLPSYYVTHPPSMADYDDDY
ncbi:hypothetical protein Tco_1110357 [Tanacetum coccineum]|uniref:Gag-Pol polyprotein n=1 Tax=Tanacetum coccineum TaxID=301880 RepID=A0ABQ5IIU8_9ASTR